MSKNSWRIEDEGVRFFLLAGDEKALLIDSGMKIHNAKEIAQQMVSLPIELLITHGDMDHVGSNGEFDKFYMSPAEASNYYHTQKKTGSFIPVENGDILDLGSRKLEIIHIPGHTPGRFDEIYPSHGSIPVLPELIPKLYEGAGSILEGAVAGADVEFHGIPLKQYDVGCAKFLCDF